MDLEYIFRLYANTGLMLDNALKMDKEVILEGAQGALLTLIKEHSHSSVISHFKGNSAHGAEFIRTCRRVVGITKAYAVSVMVQCLPNYLMKLAIIWVQLVMNLVQQLEEAPLWLV